MTLSQMQDFTFKHSQQQDAIYTQYTASQIKALFDSQGIELRTFVNSLVDSLSSISTGNSGADQIKSTPIAVNSGDTVQAQLAWLLSQIAVAATGSIPDGTLSEVKLAQALIDKINTALSNTGVLTTLTTTDKSSAVNAINEVNTHQADAVNHVRYATATGTANTYAVILNPAPTNYVEGMAISAKINVDSNAASTINVNGLGAKGIKKANGTDVTNLKANGIYTMRYDGVNFILQGEGGSGNAIASDLLSGKTASTDAGDITGTMVNRGAVTITPSTVNQTIQAGYHNGSGIVQGDADLIASNILSGKNIFGVAGTVIAGKRSASGTATSGGSTVSFQYTTGASISKYPLTVTGLSFKPSYIYAYCNEGTFYEHFSVYTEIGYFYPKTVKVFRMDGSSGGLSIANAKGDVGSASVVNGSFTIPAGLSSADYSWIAIE